jgi:[acyl-carrier-protein] S-malonyltransferase
LLTQAGQVFRTALREAEPRGPTSGVRLLSGIDGDWVENFEAGSEKLATQIATPLNWAACLESCWAAGARRALEPGPGTALNRMAARVFPNGSTRSTDEFRTRAGLRGWLARAND